MEEQSFPKRLGAGSIPAKGTIYYNNYNNREKYDRPQTIHTRRNPYRK